MCCLSILSRSLTLGVVLTLLGISARSHAAVERTAALRVGVYIDDGWQQAATGRARFIAALAAAHGTLAPALGAAPVVVGFRPWARSRSGTTGALLDALDEALAEAPWPEADLTILLVSSPPARAHSTTEWASATLGRPRGVMRTLRAHRDPDDPEGLARAEGLQVTRLLAGALGALPPCSADWMWRDLSAWPSRGEAVTPPQASELEVMRAVGTALGPSLRGALDAALVDRLLSAVRALPPSARRCQPDAFSARERLLEALRLPTRAPPPAPTPGPSACEPPPAPQDIRCIGLSLSQQGRDADAVRWLRAALDQRPDDGEVRLTLARSLGRSGDDSAALALLERHVLAQPLDARAWLNLGVAAARLGRTERARDAWSVVLRLDPAHADAAALLKALGPPPARLPSTVNP